MKDQNTEIILETLAEKIRELELELSLRDYDIKNLKEENEKLKKAVEYFGQALRKEEE